jgi:hypothetical protein
LIIPQRGGVGSPPHNPKGIPPMYEKLDMNYGRVLYESGKRECERMRENARECERMRENAREWERMRENMRENVKNIFLSTSLYFSLKFHF